MHPWLNSIALLLGAAASTVSPAVSDTAGAGRGSVGNGSLQRDNAQLLQSLDLPAADRIRIAEGLRLARELGDEIWPRWSQAPFLILLITEDREYLIGRAENVEGFSEFVRDEGLAAEVAHRPRNFPTNLLATFPAVAGTPTIVIGQAENTNARDSVRWIVTLLHEHFHQLQYSQPGYYPGVNALGLAGDDQSGMWMLNYPFPYDDHQHGKRYAVMCERLLRALRARGGDDFAAAADEYLTARDEFRGALAENDRKYLDFQFWQEGTARYTEMRLARLAADRFEPGSALRELQDFRTFSAVADEMWSDLVQDLEHPDLAGKRREVVYNLGAAEALFLDAYRPAWRENYFQRPYALDQHFTQTK